MVGSVGSGVTLRMISDIKGVRYTEGRLLPYFFPDVFTEGGDPIGEARTNWMKARRAILRSPLDRIGYGGYLKLASNWPGFIDEIQNVVGEFRQIHENMQGTKSYVAPFKVAILNCWGGLRKWMSNQVHHSIYHRETYSAEGVLECLSGMPFDVEFIDFDDIRSGIPKDIGVIINVGDAYTAFSGAENWIDEKVVTAIRKFVDEGGGFIGVGEPTACQHHILDGFLLCTLPGCVGIFQELFYVVIVALLCVRSKDLVHLRHGKAAVLLCSGAEDDIAHDIKCGVECLRLVVPDISHLETAF